MDWHDLSESDEVTAMIVFCQVLHVRIMSAFSLLPTPTPTCGLKPKTRYQLIQAAKLSDESRPPHSSRPWETNT